MAKTTPWNKIKAEFLQGVTPKELALKYKIKARSISDKAYNENWNEEKTRICENIREITQERIKELTNLAIDTLVEVVKDGKCEKNTKVSAAKALLDISGLKNSKQVIEGIDGGVNVIVNREAVSVETN